MRIPTLLLCYGRVLLFAVVPLVTQAQPDTTTTDGAALAEAARCYICHHMTEASLGPPWHAIAVRHGPRKDQMVDVLARKIVNGGGGNWGVVPMVPNQWTSIDEARRMASWILELQQ
jgi:cytochrome c